MIESVKAEKIITDIIDSPAETKGVELKPSMSWKDFDKRPDLQKVVKSILAMSNIRNGGIIILGIRQMKDKTFLDEGMAENDILTFNQDEIFQAVRNYGTPEPRFDIRNYEYRGKYYIVFIIQEFLFSPVICIKNGKNLDGEPLVKGSLYIRTYKPDTKKVDEETEMREIINLAIDKELELLTPRMNKLIENLSGNMKQPAQNKSVSSNELFSRELADLNL